MTAPSQPAPGSTPRLSMPADGTPPVPRLRQRPVHARRGNFKGIGHVTKHIGRVERGRHLTADQGRVVEAGPLAELLQAPRSELLRVFRDEFIRQKA